MPPEQQLERNDAQKTTQGAPALANEARNLAYRAKETFIGPAGTPPEDRPLTQPISAREVEYMLDKHAPHGVRRPEDLQKLLASDDLTAREKQVLKVASDNYNVIARLSNDGMLRDRNLSPEDYKALGNHDTQNLGKAAKASVVFDGLNSWFDMSGSNTLGPLVMILSTPWAVVTGPSRMMDHAAKYSHQSDRVARLMSQDGIVASSAPIEPPAPSYYEAQREAAANASNARNRSDTNAGCGLAGGIVGYQMTKGGDAMTRFTGYMVGRAFAKAACKGVDAAIEAAKENQRLEQQRSAD